ncbi:MAG: LacI family transcriptional regulator [Lentisphaerae bacterium]|nr:LacI family transcriptional regulator [Lentisphaerota bacterium]
MKDFATMEEFASELGLSRSTVSYILNGQWKSRHISEKTAAKVMDYARKVNFTPSLFGRALKGKICTDAAILIPPRMYEHHRNTFFSLLTKLEQQKLSYLVLPLHSREDNRLTIRQLQTFRVSKVIIFAATLSPDELCRWEKNMRNMPEINWFFYDHRLEHGLNRDFFPVNVSAVGFDRVSAFKMLIRHTASKGYRKLCYRAPFYTDEETMTVARQENIELISIESGDSLEKFAGHVQNILTVQSGTAVCIPDDLQSIRLIKLFRERNLNIPDDAGMISWDGLPVSNYFSPVLETLEIPHDEMYCAADRFLTGNGGGFVEVTPKIRRGETLPLRR